MTKRHLTIAALAAAFAIPATLGLSHVAIAAPNAQHVAVTSQSQREAAENGAEPTEPQNRAEANESAESAETAGGAESAEGPQSHEPKGPDTDSVKQGPGNMDDGADSETAD